jgi:hypothetical protein
MITVALTEKDLNTVKVYRLLKKAFVENQNFTKKIKSILPNCFIIS